MKKLILLTTVLLLITSPAYGSLIKSDYMEVKASTPNINGNRPADIDALNNPLEGSTEIFCVEGVRALKGKNKYDFRTIENTKYYNKKGHDITNYKTNQLKKATWFADWFLNKSDSSDKSKAVAQIAIWNTLGTIKNYNGKFLQDVYDLVMLYAVSSDKYDYVQDWAVAVSPGDGTDVCWGEVGQNFLVQMPETPEPATMFTFGMGLLFAAGHSRKTRKRINKGGGVSES